MDIFLACIIDLIGNRETKQRETWGVACLIAMFSFNSLVAGELFPIPSRIEKNVDFWTKIYSQYSSYHVLIHDRNDLSIIYKVVNLNDQAFDSLDFQQKWQAVEDTKDRYRQILRILAQKRLPVNLDSLTADERHVYILWAQNDDPQKFTKAIYAVRAQPGLRDQFEESIRRAGYYQKYIESIFESFDVPLPLSYLPHVESLFDEKAYSKVGAAGVWQFMRYTGRLFMTINAAVDERLDPIIAAKGAAQLLKSNYDELQSWPLAVTAYNHGVNGMLRAKELCGTDDFGVIYENYTSSMFSFASKNFYAEFLAAWHVAENHTAYFGDVKPYPTIRFQSIELPNAIHIKQLAEIFNVPIDTLVAYNPAFRKPVIRNEMRVPQGYELRLPYRDGFDPHAAMILHSPPHRPPVISSTRRRSIPRTTSSASLPDSIRALNVNNTELEAYIMQKLATEPTPNLLNIKADNELPVRGN